MILNDLERLNDRYFALFSLNLVAYGAHCVKVVDDIPKLSRQKCSPKFLVFSDISLTTM